MNTKTKLFPSIICSMCLYFDFFSYLIHILCYAFYEISKTRKILALHVK